METEFVWKCYELKIGVLQSDKTGRCAESESDTRIYKRNNLSIEYPPTPRRVGVSQ